MDLIIKNAKLPHKEGTFDIACKEKKIVSIAPQIKERAKKIIDAQEYLVSPPFVDSHFHLDAALSLGIPRLNQSGTLLEGIQLWGELKKQTTKKEIIQRALKLCEWSVAKGVLFIRSHVDVSGPDLKTVEALLEVREKVKDFLELQLVAFPQDGFLRSKKAKELLLKSLDLGVDVVGGIPHFERTMQDGADSIRELCEIAAAKKLLVDLHCDETDDPLSRHIETLSYETIRLKLEDKVAASHLTSMHSMDNYYVSKLLPLIKEAQIAAIANPLINITIQGRHDSYPKRRGLTRVKEMWDYNIPVAFGHDCVMDPWYSFGTHDMLEVCFMAIHVGLLTSLTQVKSAYDAITEIPASILKLKNYGIKKGCNADFVILQAKDIFEAIRIKPTRLYVIKNAKIIAQTSPYQTKLHLKKEETFVDFCKK